MSDDFKLKTIFTDKFHQSCINALINMFYRKLLYEHWRISFKIWTLISIVRLFYSKQTTLKWYMSNHNKIAQNTTKKCVYLMKTLFRKYFEKVSKIKTITSSIPMSNKLEILKPMCHGSESNFLYFLFLYICKLNVSPKVIFIWLLRKKF